MRPDLSGAALTPALLAEAAAAASAAEDGTAAAASTAEGEEEGDSGGDSDSDGEDDSRDYSDSGSGADSRSNGEGEAMRSGRVPDTRGLSKEVGQQLICPRGMEGPGACAPRTARHAPRATHRAPLTALANLVSPQERKRVVKEFNRERRKNKMPKHVKKRKQKLAKIAKGGKA